MSDLIPVHLTWLRAGGRSDRTVNARQRLLEHADRNLPFGLDAAHTDEWATYLAGPSARPGQRGWSTWTRHTYFNHGYGYYEWAVGNEYLTLNPLAGLIRPPQGDRLPDPATDEEIIAALMVLPEQPWRMAVRLAVWAGLRCCEIVTLRREDCCQAWLRVRRKGGKLAAIAMAPPLWRVIEPRPPGLLVTGARGQPLTAQMLTQMQGRIWRRIGQPHQHLHRFRAWFCTRMIADGADIRTVQELMGHANVTSTQGYAAVVDPRRTAAVALLPDLTQAPARP